MATIVALLAACSDTQARPKQKGKRTMTYDDAVALLQQPARWCDGAAALAKLGDHRAVRPLATVVLRTEEGLPDRACVRAALEKLGVRDEAVKLVASAQVADRRIGILLLKEFPADAHPAILAGVARNDADPDLRGLAARAVRTQKVTAAWDAAMLSLLDAGDAATRAMAAQGLQRRFGAPIRAALGKRLGVETDGGVRTELEAAIKLHDERAAKQP